MRRPWLAQWRGWGRRPPGRVLGMAWGSAGKRRPTVSPIHTGRREMPGLHLQPRSRPPPLGPRASRALHRRPRSPLPAPRSPLPAGRRASALPSQTGLGPACGPSAVLARPPSRGCGGCLPRGLCLLGALPLSGRRGLAAALKLAGAGAVRREPATAPRSGPAAG